MVLQLSEIDVAELVSWELKITTWYSNIKTIPINSAHEREVITPAGFLLV